MSDPLKEHEDATAAVLKEIHLVVQRMRETDSMLPEAFLEKRVHPRLDLFRLDIAIAEAKRCDAYGKIGSPRVIELEAARNKVAFEVAKLDAGKRRP